MHDNICEISFDDVLEELLNFCDMLRRVVHLAETVADLVLQKVTMLLDTEGLDQSIDSFDLLKGPQAEKRVNTFSNRRFYIIQAI